MKFNAGKQDLVSNYFWRTYTGAKLDYIEEKNGTLYGFEFKSGSKTVKAPTGWLKAYPESKYQCINKNNYLDFILG